MHRSLRLLAMAAVLSFPPAAIAQSFHAKEWFPGQSLGGRASASMGEGTTYGLSNAPPWLRIDPATGAISGTLPADAATAENVAVVATKKGATATSPVFDVRVAKPTAEVSGATEVVEGTEVLLSATTNLPEPAWSLMEGPAWLAIDPSTGTISGTPGDVAAPAPWTAVALARSGPASARRTLSGAVVPASASVAGIPQIMFHGQTVAGRASTTLAAGATWQLLNAPSWLAIDASTGATSGAIPAHHGNVANVVARATRNGAVADSAPVAFVVKAPTLTMEQNWRRVVSGRVMRDMPAQTNLPQPVWTLENGTATFIRVNGSGTVSGTAPEVGANTDYTGRLTASQDGAKASEFVTIRVVTAAWEAAAFQTFRMYDCALGRLPEYDGFENWVTRILNGMTPQQLAEGFMGSAEYQSVWAGYSDDRAWIARLYQVCLHRAGSDAEINGWLSTVQSQGRARLVSIFNDTGEHVGITQGPYNAWMHF